jgi:hypothetical protein
MKLLTKGCWDSSSRVLSVAVSTDARDSQPLGRLWAARHMRNEGPGGLQLQFWPPAPTKVGPGANPAGPSNWSCCFLLLLPTAAAAAEPLRLLALLAPYGFACGCIAQSAPPRTMPLDPMWLAFPRPLRGGLLRAHKGWHFEEDGGRAGGIHAPPGSPWFTWLPLAHPGSEYKIAIGKLWRISVL